MAAARPKIQSPFREVCDIVCRRESPYQQFCDIVCNALYDLDEKTENYAGYGQLGHPNRQEFETYAHYENCGCDQIRQEDIPIIARRYFYFTNQHGALELVDVYSDVNNDPTQPRSLLELSTMMAREKLKSWLNYRMSILKYHYSDFVRLQQFLRTTMGIPLPVSKLVLPSLREPRYAVHFLDSPQLHKAPGELFFGDLRRYSGQFHGFNSNYFGPDLFPNEYVLWAHLFAFLLDRTKEYRIIHYISQRIKLLRPNCKFCIRCYIPEVVLPNDAIYGYSVSDPEFLRSDLEQMTFNHDSGRGRGRRPRVRL